MRVCMQVNRKITEYKQFDNIAAAGYLKKMKTHKAYRESPFECLSVKNCCEFIDSIIDSNNKLLLKY